MAADQMTVRGRRGRDHMVVWFTTTYAINAYHHYSCEFESRSWRGLLDITLCDKVCQWLAAGRWFSPVSSTNKIDRHDITEIVLKEVLNAITLPPMMLITTYINALSWLHSLVCPPQKCHTKGQSLKQNLIVYKSNK